LRGRNKRRRKLQTDPNNTPDGLAPRISPSQRGNSGKRGFIFEVC